MTKRPVTNVPASVFARLKKLALAQRIDVQLVLTRYFIERLLYRLSQSGERDNFILKGAMLFSTEWARTANQERAWRAFLRRCGLTRTALFADVVDRLQNVSAAAGSRRTRPVSI